MGCGLAGELTRRSCAWTCVTSGCLINCMFAIYTCEKCEEGFGFNQTLIVNYPPKKILLSYKLLISICEKL